MSENILKEIYKNKYEINQFDEENNIRNILVHFLNYTKISGGYKTRLEYDCDAYYYKKYVGLEDEAALYADTMISFWTPYKLAIYKATGVRYIQTEKSLTELIERIDNKDSEILRINKIFEPFAKIYYTKGNFMLLPKRMMNNSRYRICQDRIDETVYQCFEGGKLSCYFKDDDELIKWINEENLSYIFKYKNIKKEDIIPYNTQSKLSSFSNLNQIEEYIDRAVDLISERNR